MSNPQPTSQDHPGVSNADWQARKLAAFARGQGNAMPIYVERASNAEVWDIEGNRYIDFGTGIAVCNTGHSNPRVVAAVKEQLDKFSHTCVMVTPYDTAVRLAEALNELAPGTTPKKSMFVTTGAEAVENTVKIARAYTGRSAVSAFNGAGSPPAGNSVPSRRSSASCVSDCATSCAPSSPSTAG